MNDAALEAYTREIIAAITPADIQRAKVELKLERAENLLKTIDEKISRIEKLEAMQPLGGVQ